MTDFFSDALLSLRDRCLCPFNVRVAVNPKISSTELWRRGEPPVPRFITTDLLSMGTLLKEEYCPVAGCSFHEAEDSLPDVVKL